MSRLWDALGKYQLRKRDEILPAPGFCDPGKLQLSGSMFPTVPASSSEGKGIWKNPRNLEREREFLRFAQDGNPGWQLPERWYAKDAISHMAIVRYSVLAILIR